MVLLNSFYHEDLEEHEEKKYCLTADFADYADYLNLKYCV